MIGKWNELNVEIITTIDPDIDKLIEIGHNPAFQGLSGLAFQIKNSIEKASKKGTEHIAKHNRSLQQRFISDLSVHPYASGVLSSSIIIQGSDLHYFIGTRINHIYPMAVEKGRRGFSAKDGGVLWFYSLSGEIVFTKRVGPAEPRPFVEPAYKETERIAQKVMDTLIDKELSAFR